MTELIERTETHPAKFTPEILAAAMKLLHECWPWEWASRPLVLDPFAGTGRIHELRKHGCRTVGVELEPEFAAWHRDTLVGDATRLPVQWAGRFDAVVTSPCMEQSQRVLTDDLRWVPVGDVKVGDRVVAFDEVGAFAHDRGPRLRRKWQHAEVVRSEPKIVQCVRVILADGNEIITTPEHPWLTQRYAYNNGSPEWVEAQSLMSLHSPHVLRQVEPWVERTSKDAGWLAGMFDGEGSLSLGDHGAPKLCMYQVNGPVIDHAEALMKEFGYEPNRIERRNTPTNRQPVSNLYVTGGFPTMLRALGELRPIRLLDKWAQLDISTRTVQPEYVAVLAVEPCRRREIQEIETTAGTYFGEGYMMHNCYGNRMADRDMRDSVAGTYMKSLRRAASPGSSCHMQWGGPYRDLHTRAWREAWWALQPGGVLVINIKDHYRGWDRQFVSSWHFRTLRQIGFQTGPRVRVRAGGLTRGENDHRIPYEHVAAFVKPDAA